MVRTRRSIAEEAKVAISTDDRNSIEEEEVPEVDGVSENGSDSDDDQESENDSSKSGSDEDDSENDESDSESESETEENPSHPALLSKRQNMLRKKETKSGKNALTSLVPGYTAPMRLDSSSLDKYRCDIRELGKRAELHDASTKDFSLEATRQKASANLKSSKGFLPKSYASAYSHFKKGVKRAPDESAGKGWFGMKPSAMTDDLKKDLAIIRNRTYLDPKRFYKSTDKHHAVVQVGTVIEGAAEFYSSRLTKKERRANLTEELMADPKVQDYAKSKFQKMAREKAYQAELRKNRPKKRKKFY